MNIEYKKYSNRTIESENFINLFTNYFNVQTFANEGIRKFFLFSGPKLSQIRSSSFFRVRKLSRIANFEIFRVNKLSRIGSLLTILQRGKQYFLILVITNERN